MRNCGHTIATFSIRVLALLPIAVPASATTEIGSHLPSQLQGAQVAVPFDGIWEGKILFDKEAFLGPGSTPIDGAEFRVEIHGAVVRVFAKMEGEFSETKPGAFHIAPVGVNAVIFATDAQPDSWVESWTFVVSQKDNRTLVVEFSRLVNNLGLLRDDPQKNFGTRGTGEFKLISQ